MGKLRPRKEKFCLASVAESEQGQERPDMHCPGSPEIQGGYVGDKAMMDTWHLDP